MPVANAAAAKGLNPESFGTPGGVTGGSDPGVGILKSPVSNFSATLLLRSPTNLYGLIP